MVVTMKMNADLLEQTQSPVISVPQNDGECRVLQIALSAGQEQWEVPEGANVRMYYCKPDGTGGSYDTLPDGTCAWYAEGHMVSVTLIPQMFTEAGPVAAKLEFVQDGKFLHTFGFWIRVVEDRTENAVESEDYFNWAAWTSGELDRMLAEAKASGVFRGEQGEDGYSPVRGMDYWTQADLEQITQEISLEVADQLADKVQLTPEFADKVEDCTDASKLYVLPDGYIYACMEHEELAYTNLAGDVQENTRQNTSGVALASSGAVLTGFIPVSQGQKVRVRGFNPMAAPESYPFVCFYTGASESDVVSDTIWGRGDGMFTLNGDVYEWTAFILQTGLEHTLADSITHIRINGTMTGAVEDIVVTVDEEITDETVTVVGWYNTGHAFVPADYEDRILELEAAAESDGARITALEDTVESHGTRIGALEEKVTETDPTQIWKGKKWVAMGDSLTYDEYVTTSAYYHDHIAQATGITVVNMGQGGTGYKRTFDTGSGYAFYQRIRNVPTDADVITIFGSGNDLSTTWETYGLGEATDTGTDTICGCINTTLDNLFSVYPTANVGIITPAPWKHFYPSAVEADGKPYRMTQLCEKLIEICRMRSIPCLDLYHCSGLRPWDKAFRDAFYTKDDVESDGELGGVHPDKNGHTIIAAKIRHFLETLLM